MKTRTSITNQSSVITFKNGVVQNGYQGCSDVNTFRVVYAGTGNRVDPVPLRYWKVISTGLRGLCTQNNPDSGYLKEAGGFTSPFDSDGEAFSSSAWQETIAYNKAVSQLGDMIRGNVDLSIDLFQGHKTLATVKRIVNPLATLKSSIRKARRNGSEHEVASLYLEWIYGIKPTLQTLYECVERIRNEVKADKPVVRIRARGSCKVKNVESFAINGFGYQNGYSAAEVDSRVRCQLIVNLKTNRDKVQTIAAWTSMNPASIAWELVPYSFVVDWFYNIGGYLRELETALTHADIFVSGVKHIGYKKTSKCVKPTVFAGTLVWTGLSGSHYWTVCDRSLLSSYPFPRVPRVHADLGAQRIINAAALLTQIAPIHTGSRR